MPDDPSSPGQRPRGNAWPCLLLTLAPLFWSGNVVIGRAVRGAIAPASITFWRWIIALAILLPLAGSELWRQRRLLWSRWKILGLMGFLGIFFYQLLSYQALTLTTALNALLISATSPLLVALINWFLYREKISLRLGAAIALSMLGVLAVITRGDPRALFGLHFNSGDLLMLSAAIVWAVYSILLQRHRPPEISPLGLVSILGLIGLLFVTPIFIWQTALGERVAFVKSNLLALGYIGLFASVLAYLCWNEGIALGGANLAGLFFNLMPIFGVVLAVIFLGEVFASYHLAGMILVFGGIVLGNERLFVRAKSPTS